MAAVCWSSVRGKMMRATKIDSCGAIVTGAGGMLVTKGFVQVSYALEIDEGTEISVPDANGDLCINEPGSPTVKWLNVEAQFCKVDPDLVNLFTGWPVVLNAAGAGTGFRIRDTIQVGAGVGLEVWTDIAGQTCVAGDKLYGYFLAPWVNQGILGDIEIKNGEATFTLSGKARKGSAWGTGPYLVDTAALDAPAKLISAIGENDFMDIHVTTQPPPVAACGAQVLTPAA